MVFEPSSYVILHGTERFKKLLLLEALFSLLLCSPLRAEKSTPKENVEVAPSVGIWLELFAKAGFGAILG